MGEVTLPVWLVVLAAILATIGLIDRLLAPSVRWFFRRRANKAIEKLNSSLSLKIQPFKLTKREALIDALMFDEQVIDAVELEAKQSGTPREIIMQKARKYAHEVVPAFSQYTYFKIGTKLAKKISQMLYRVRLGNPNDKALADIKPNSSVVFVMNHRSNMDYVLVTYMAAASSALSYAVGEWARIWALQNLIRAMGAYFVRRQSSSNPLYRKVLARYVHMATIAGVTQAVFPEGGLSLDGAIRPPKFGLLAYMVADFDPKDSRDIVFIPVGLNYDRVLEDRLLISKASKKSGHIEKFKFSPKILFGFIYHSIGLAIKGHWFRYGYACVSFGKPISLKSYLDDNKFDLRLMGEEQRYKQIEKLGQNLMSEVGKAVPVLPVSLVATIFEQEGAGLLSLFEIKSKIFNLIKELEEKNIHVHIPRNDHDYLVDVGLRMLILRHIIKVEDKKYRANWEEKLLIKYYANSIAHLL